MDRRIGGPPAAIRLAFAVLRLSALALSPVGPRRRNPQRMQMLYTVAMLGSVPGESSAFLGAGAG
jgi:hypothetical protein